jgi:ribosomal protein L12E/L44/L45/RPP1/RPP2
MISLKKLLILALLVVAGYLFWPRTPSLNRFDPPTLARLETEAWQQASRENWVAYSFTTFRIYTTQYDLHPLAAVRVALDRARAVFLMRSVVDGTDLDEAIKQLALAWTELGKQTGAKFDPAVQAAREVTVWTAVKEERTEDAVKALADSLSLLYGTKLTEMIPLARDLIGARLAARSSDWSAAQEALKKGLTGLRQSLAPAR